MDNIQVFHWLKPYNLKAISSVHNNEFKLPNKYVVLVTSVANNHLY